jgi:DNA-directed RNA polymerase specialized sigma24 family protein
VRHAFVAAATGSSAAREQLFAERFEGVFAFLRMAHPDAAQAERCAVDVLVTAVERHGECPAATGDVDAWLRGIALEHVAGAAIRTRGSNMPVAGLHLRSERLGEALVGVNDTALAALVRALDPLTRQVVVLGAMAGLDDKTVADVVGVEPAGIERLRRAGLAEIARLLDSYHRETEEIGIRALQNAYHLRPKRGPMSDGMIVVEGTRATVAPGPGSGFLYMALRAIVHLFGRFVRHHHHGPPDDDVGGVNEPKAPKRTAGEQPFRQPRRTPSLTEYATPKPTPGMPSYRTPNRTPSTERLSSPRPTAGRRAAFGGQGTRRF